MDSFEQIVAAGMMKQGYWTDLSVKVNLTPKQKAKIGRKTTPRWEIDVLAYKASENKLYAIECKSYLDSNGVSSKSFGKVKDRKKDRYKLFNEDKTRKVIFSALKKQFVQAGLSLPRTSIQLCLAAGNFQNQKSEKELRDLFRRKGWLLIGPDKIRDQLRALSNESYENSIVAVTAKMLLRDRH